MHPIDPKIHMNGSDLLDRSFSENMRQGFVLGRKAGHLNGNPPVWYLEIQEPCALDNGKVISIEERPEIRTDLMNSHVTMMPVWFVIEEIRREDGKVEEIATKFIFQS